jgi:prolactin regulatory element-binding protein
VYLVSDSGSLDRLSTVSVPPPEGDGAPLAFRAVRFAPESSRTPALLAVLNSAPSRRDRRAPRKAYVVKFDAAEEVDEKEAEKEEAVDEKADDKPKKLATRPKDIKWSLMTRREVSRKPITVFDVSADGRLVAFGASDLSIGMMDAKTLAVSGSGLSSLTTAAPPQDSPGALVPAYRAQVQPRWHAPRLCQRRQHDSRHCRACQLWWW